MTEPQDTGGETGGSGRVGLVGKTLGRYRISGEVGRGGMATVYRAFDPQLARDVAVKVMHGAFTGRGDIERRFRREAQAVAALKHESIVDVFDFAPGGDGEPAYIVSELVEGPTLRQLLERAGGRIVPEVATVIAARVAAALGAAHARGIVHRDIKPDNVLIDLGKGRARVLLTDFGIARMTEDETMTATGSILGSPAYMSPEQAKSGAIGPASDVFSLGVTLYQMVTGRTPFPGRDPLSAIAALLAGEFLRPTQVDARVSPELETVILRCLKRQPGERYADGSALGAALRELCGSGALADDGAALRGFHDDHWAFERGIGGAIADAAVVRARASMGRGELSKALAHINRAFAYVPDHREAASLLATISSRRRWGKRAAVAACLLAAGGALAGLRGGRRAPVMPETFAGVVPSPSAARSPTLPAVAPTLPAVAPTPPVAPATAAPAQPPVSPTSPTAASAGAPRRRERERAKPRAAVAPAANAPVATAATASAPTPNELVAPTVEPPEPAPSVAPTPHPPAAPAPTAGITLRAWQGFCSPSLDERPAALRPIYEGVAIGAHKVYCTPPGGARALAGTYELHAGTHPNLVVVPGPDGRPTLSRPQ